MRHVRTLIESRLMLIRVPDQSLIVGDPLKTTDRIQAARGSDGSYAFVYTASGKPVTINVHKVSGTTVQAHWYDPRNGTSKPIGRFSNDTKTRRFAPPTSGPGNDWVLVLEDSSKDYPPPGKT
jgi:hypothetical protein